MRRARTTALLASTLFLLGCAAGRPRHIALGSSGAPEVAKTAVPARLHGLAASEEDVSKTLAMAGRDAYITSARLWSLREGTRLRATVQVARFAPDAPVADIAFQRQVLAQLGGSSVRRRRLGDDVVFVAGGNRQTYYAWFRGAHLVVLSVATDTKQSRQLLRDALAEVRP